jgi:hypothetical protein
MSRGVFHSVGGKAEEWCFQTNRDSAAAFNPTITTVTNDRVSWDLGDGTLLAGNTISHTYSDTGTTKTVCVRTNRVADLGTMITDSSEKFVGHMDFSGWSNFGASGVFFMYSNPGITRFTFPSSNQVINNFLIQSNSSITEVDLSTLNVGGQINMAGCGSLTAVTHGYTTQNFLSLNFNSCDITGNYDLTMFPNLGGQFTGWVNSNLTSVTHTASTKTFSQYYLYFNDMTGTHDVSMLSGLGGAFRMNNNPNLTSILNPTSTQSFSNYWVDDCDIDYINFYPLSGSSMSNIRLNDNNMTTSEVNRFLVEFNDISTNLNTVGWSGTTLWIHGTNSAPDGSSGGYDGLAALSSLTGGTNNWTITTS